MKTVMVVVGRRRWWRSRATCSWTGSGYKFRCRSLIIIYYDSWYRQYVLGHAYARDCNVYDSDPRLVLSIVAVLGFAGCLKPLNRAFRDTTLF